MSHKMSWHDQKSLKVRKMHGHYWGLGNPRDFWFQTENGGDPSSNAFYMYDVRPPKKICKNDVRLLIQFGHHKKCIRGDDVN